MFHLKNPDLKKKNKQELLSIINQISKELQPFEEIRKSISEHSKKINFEPEPEIVEIIENKK